MAKQLRAKFCGDGNSEADITIGSVIYSFRAGITGIAQKYPDKMETLLRDTVCLIHRLFSGETVENDKYLNLLAKKWWKGKEETIGSVKRKSQNREKTEKVVSDYSAITCKYLLGANGEQFTLNIPAFRLLSGMEQLPQLEILCGNETVYTAQMDTRGSGIVMSAKPLSLRIQDITAKTGISELRVIIRHAGEVIYDSRTGLYRQFILFRNEREVFAQNCQPGNYLLYTPSTAIFRQSPQTLCYLKNNIYNVTADDGEILRTEKQTVFFSAAKQDLDIWIKADIRVDVSFVSEQQEYSVLNGDLFVQVKKDKTQEEYGVQYGEARFHLTDFARTEDGEFFSYPITSVINVGEPYCVRVFRWSDNKTVSLMNVVKFNHICISYDKPIYYGSDDTGTVTFRTDKYYETKKFHIDDSEVTVALNGGFLHFTPPIVYWRIDDGDWHCRPADRPLWYKAVTNSSLLEWKLPKNVAGKLLLSDGQEVAADGRNSTCFKLGQTVHATVGRSDTVTAVYRFNEEIISGEQKYSLITVATFVLTEKFTSSPFVFSEQVLHWNPQEVFIGDAGSTFEITVSDGKGYANSFRVGLSAQQINLAPMKEGYYSVTVCLIKGIFGGKRELRTEKVCVGDERELRYRDRVFNIRTVMLTGEIVPRTLYRDGYYIDNLHFMYEKDGSLYYSGRIYIIRQDGTRHPLNNMPNEQGDYEKVNPVRLELRTSNSLWLSYKDDVEDFVDFLLDTRNRISISMAKTGVFGIDFYYFQSVPKSEEERENNV